MKAESYLTKRGQQYFISLEKILKAKGLDDDSYSIKLSMLANELSKYEDCHIQAKERERKKLPGFYNEYENNTVQVNAFFTMAKEASASIDKLSAKFGLTPLDMSKLKDMVKEPKKKDVLEEL